MRTSKICSQGSSKVGRGLCSFHVIWPLVRAMPSNNNTSTLKNTCATIQNGSTPLVIGTCACN